MVDTTDKSSESKNKKIKVSTLGDRKNDTLVLKSEKEISEICKILSNIRRVKLFKSFDGQTKSISIANDIGLTLQNLNSHMKNVHNASINMLTVDTKYGIRIYSRRFDFIIVDLT